MPDVGWCQKKRVPYIPVPEGSGFTAQHDKGEQIKNMILLFLKDIY